MTDTLTRTDDAFARSLRERVDAVVPMIDVDTTRVVPAARRARRRRRAAVASTCALAVVAGAAGWAAHEQGFLRTEPLLPANIVPYVPDADAPTIDGGWPDAPYWRVQYEQYYLRSNGEETTSVRTDWLGHTEPGLLTDDSDPAGAIPIGPSDWAYLLIDGTWVSIGWDGLYALPTDPVELELLLRGSVEPDRGSGTDDDKVFDMARTLLTSSPAPPALRDALWQVILSLPTTTGLGEVQDSKGRPGSGAEITLMGTSTTRIIYDATAHRVLEESNTNDGDDLGPGEIMSLEWRATYLEEGPADDTPVEPSLEDSGCVAWETC